MIYRNFLYFIIAIILFIAAPSTPNELFPFFEDFLIILILVLLFSHHARNSFFRMRRKYSDDDTAPVRFRFLFQRTTDVLFIKALVFFAAELYLFDLKLIVNEVLVFGGVTFIADLGILLIFILHVSVVWYWGYRMAGDIILLSTGPGKYIADNIKFNLAIVIPWMILTIGTDLVRLVDFNWINVNSGSPFFQLAFLALFLVIFLIAGPALIIRLWDCTPLPEGEIRNSIIEFAKREGISFRDVLSWNSLNKSLLTAGVIGYFPFARYLLITPELIQLLSREELIAVVSHETGHVKRKHILYYLVLFIGFAVFSGALIGLLNLLFLNSSFGIRLLTSGGGMIGVSFFNLVMVFFSLLIFVLYFRFVFGYFMRHFEREADTFCFESGVDPEFLIRSFEKLGAGIKEKKGSNWHHFSISERVEFLKKCIGDPSLIGRHRKKVKKGFVMYLVILALVIFISVNPLTGTFTSGLEQKAVIKAIEMRVEKTPDDHRLYAALAGVYHEREDWGKSKENYERSLSLKYDQPETLNNYAWLLVTCPDETVREKRKGLRLARDAASLRSAAHIYDTLAEALLLNERYEEAVRASQTALSLAEGDPAYFQNQLNKMEKQLKRSRSTFKL